jgi:hypothetical protein
MNGQDVKIISICDLMDMIFPKYWENERYKHIDYDESSEAMRQWCKTHNAHYYAREKHCFSKVEAIVEAQKLGKSIVVVEDLS